MIPQSFLCNCVDDEITDIETNPRNKQIVFYKQFRFQMVLGIITNTKDKGYFDNAIRDYYAMIT